MTEPVAAAASPRRAVRIAVALVTGQALLCGVIGWLTVTGDEPEAPGRIIDPLAAPTPAMPTAAPVLPPAAVPSSDPPRSRPAPSRGTGRRAPAPEPSRADKTPPRTGRPSPVRASAVAPKPPAVAPSPDLADTAGPEPTEEVQGPVVIGEPCDPPGARGLTADDVALRCVREGERLVWRIA